MQMFVYTFYVNVFFLMLKCVNTNNFVKIVIIANYCFNIFLKIILMSWASCNIKVFKTKTNKGKYFEILCQISKKLY